MTNKEDEQQLLQDASTLLMFANVAAKQQQQYKTSPTESPSQPQHVESPINTTAIPLTQPVVSVPAPVILHSPEQQNRPPPFSPVNQYPNVIPSGHPIPHQVQFTSHIPVSVPHPPQQAQQLQSPSIVHPGTPQFHRVSPPVPVISSNNSSPKESSRKTSKSSISVLMNSPEPETVPQPQSQPITIIPAPVPLPIQELKPKPVEIYPRSTQISLSALVSPPLPSTSGSAPTNNHEKVHHRSKSSPEIERSQLPQHQLSPGPGLSGINIESGQRNTNNAVIAAAALAAAADIPLPLKHVKEEVKINVPVIPPPQPQPQSHPQITEQSPDDTIKDEDQLTEPENDDKTDDEKTEEEIVVKSNDILPPKNQEPVTQSQPEKKEPSKEQQEFNNKQEQFNIPPLSSYQVDADSGLIGCICGIDDDDGFTIQCDVCYRWQHCLCMGYKTNEEVPEDEYTCYYCDKTKWGKFNAEECRIETLERLDSDFKNSQRTLDSISTPSSEFVDDDSIGDQNNKEKQKNGAGVGAGKRKHSNSEKVDKRRKVVENGVVEKKKESTPIETTVVEQPKAPTVIVPNKDNELLEDGVTSETYQSGYYKLRTNDYKKKSIKEFFLESGQTFYQEYLNLPKTDQQKRTLRDIEIMTQNQFKSLKMSKILLPNYQKYLAEHKLLIKKKNFNKTSIQVKQYLDNQKQKFNGISKLSLFISSNDSEVLTIPENTIIIEYLGEIDLFENYIKDTINQYSMWGTPKPKVLKTNLKLTEEKDLDLIVDSRFVGNESRFIRKSCPSSSNCRIQPIYIPEQNSFRFLVVTSKPIVLKSESADEELRLNWEWEADHPILKLYENNNSEKFDILTNAHKSALISYIDNILHFVECGCSTSSSYSSCAIFKIKKATSYLLRSTRKASSISNINLAKSKDELILPKKEKEYISWSDRLVERDNVIQMNLTLTTQSTKANDEVPVVESQTEHTEQNGAVTASLETSPRGVRSKPDGLFSIPYKQQLMVNNKQFLRKIAEIKNEDNNENEGAKYDIEDGFQISSDMVIKIENNIDDKLKPIVEEVEAKIAGQLESIPIVNSAKVDEAVSIPEKLITLEHKTASLVDVRTNSIGTIAAPITDNKNIVKKEETVNVKEPVPSPPKVVKKLSFADYKKKMKE
ncbi:histone deacetylase complex [Scheffersomyces coipomensis]|uniref:histone deacetylase complex n=1 Tax=Scheffersomyces coipomensis TaxID=1788519 RepID=UPI00315D994C